MHQLPALRDDHGSLGRFSWLSGVRMALMLLGLALGLRAQTYQTSFSEIKFDRAKAPSTWHGGFEVEAPTGAVNVSLPLGPGIGARGAVFQPKLTVRWSPQTKAREEFDPTGNLTTDVLDVSTPQWSLDPGYLNLALPNGAGLVGGRIDTRFVISNGPAGTIRGLLPQESITGAPALNTSSILAAFGMDPALQVAPVPYLSSQGTPTNSLIKITTSDGVLIGLSSAAKPLLVSPGGGCPAVTSTFPQVLLLVQGDVAYEFEFDGFMELEANCRVVNASQVPTLAYHAHFRLKRIRNRFAEYVEFNYLPGFQATFVRPGNTGAVPTVTRGDQPNGQIKITYSGSAEANPSFTIQTVDPWAVNGAMENREMQSLVATKAEILGVGSVTQDQTGEKVSFGYALGDDHMVVISGITFPNRGVSFVWKSYAYVAENNSTETIGSTSAFRQTTMGVTQITEQAMANGAAEGTPRITTFDRTVPQPVVDPTRPLRWASGPSYTSTGFHVGVQKGGGPIQVVRLAPAIPGGVSLTSQDPNQPGAWDAIQRLMHLKHLVIEERTYEPGANWKADLATPIESSIAYYRKRHPMVATAWSLRRAGNPAGLLLSSAMPYPLITETWEALGKTGATITRHTKDTTGDGTNTEPSWSNTAMTWTSKSKVVRGVESGGSWTQNTTLSFDPQLDVWLYPRKVQETTTVTQDTTKGFASGQALPYALPVNKQALDAATNLPLTVQKGDITATFTYGTTGPAKALPQRAVLSGTGLAQSGAVGVSGSAGAPGYVYDNLGFLTSIQQMGMDWTVQQISDPFGRPTTQTDPNGHVVRFTYDAAGRLKSIAPPNGEVATTFTYDDVSHRKVTVTRGAQQAEYTYNGFSELIRQRRWGGAAWSNKLTGYDTQGRVTGESVWVADAAVNESQWSNPAFIKSTSVPSGLYVGTSYQYDLRGRQILVVNPNKEKITTDYTGLDKVTSAYPTDSQPLATRFTSDILGRLEQVTDAMGQPTQYRYDPAGRILQVVQTDPATSKVQTRTWEYNAQNGWVTALNQLESGRTEYTGFTVLGKPQTVRYGVVGGAPAVSLSYVYDTIGRVKTATGSDSSVSQTFGYDSTANSSKGKGKLTSAADGGITRTLEYKGLNGRLSSLTRGIDGRSFLQTFSYDTYGNLTTRAYPDHAAPNVAGPSQGLGMNAAKGVPESLTLGTSPLATLVYDETTWNLSQLSFAGTLSSSQFFGYRDDQVGLKTLLHSIPGQTGASWTYGYDGAGRLTGDGEDVYRYDALNRLREAFVRDPFDALQGKGSEGIWQTFVYDAFGNRRRLDSWRVTNWTQGALPPTTPSTAVTAKAQTYDFAATDAAFSKNQLPAATSTGASTGAQYDTRGNLKGVYKEIGQAAKALSLTYDALGRVKTMADAARNVVEVYLYDDEGLRAVTEVYQGSVAPQNLQKKQYRVYNEARQLVSEFELVRE